MASGVRKPHQLLITIGCLLWVASSFCEASNWQPYSTAGLIISPFITVTGVVYWFKYYRLTRGYSPPFVRRFREFSSRASPFSGISFVLTHIPEVWTLSILFWMALTFIGSLAFGQSDALTATKAYCQKDPYITGTTGQINYFSPLISGNIHFNKGEGEAHFDFTIVGAKGNFPAQADLEMRNGNWEVKTIKLEP